MLNAVKTETFSRQLGQLGILPQVNGVLNCVASHISRNAQFKARYEMLNVCGTYNDIYMTKIW